MAATVPVAPGDWHGCRHDGQGPMVDEPPKPHRPASPGRWAAKAAPLRSSSGCHLLGLQVTDDDAVVSRRGVSQLQPKHWRLCLHPLLRPSDGRLLLLRPCRRSHACRAWPFGGSLKTRGCQLGRHGGNRADWHGCRHDGQGPMVDEPPKPHRPASPGRWAAKAAPLRSSSGCHLLGLQVTDDDAIVSRRGVSQLQPKHWRLCLHPLLRLPRVPCLALWRIPQNPWVPTWPSWRQPCQWRRATGTVAAMTARGRWLMSLQSRIARHLQGGGQQKQHRCARPAAATCSGCR